LPQKEQLINTKLNQSTDWGNTFKQVNGISDGYYIDSIAIATNETIYVGTEKEGQRDSGLLYKSTDGTNFKSFSGIVGAIKCVYLLNGSGWWNGNWMGYTLLDTNYVEKWTNWWKERNYNYG